MVPCSIVQYNEDKCGSAMEEMPSIGPYRYRFVSLSYRCTTFSMEIFSGRIDGGPAVALYDCN